MKFQKTYPLENESPKYNHQLGNSLSDQVVFNKRDILDLCRRLENLEDKKVM